MNGIIRTRKILLTSAGFEVKTISDAFLNLVGKEPNEIKILFILTAAIAPDTIANDPGALKVLPKCVDDLIKINIPANNIKVFDLHRSLSDEELSAFDAIYFTGGSPSYLLERINNTEFNKPLKDFVNNGGVYIGVSAGSIVAAGNLPDNLGYMKASLRVHREAGTGTAPGIFDNDAVVQIDLTDNTAVLVHGDKYEII
jgi:peptidase E